MIRSELFHRIRILRPRDAWEFGVGPLADICRNRETRENRKVRGHYQDHADNANGWKRLVKIVNRATGNPNLTTVRMPLSALSSNQKFFCCTASAWSLHKALFSSALRTETGQTGHLSDILPAAQFLVQRVVLYLSRSMPNQICFQQPSSHGD